MRKPVITKSLREHLIGKWGHCSFCDRPATAGKIPLPPPKTRAKAKSLVIRTCELHQVSPLSVKENDALKSILGHVFPYCERYGCQRFATHMLCRATRYAYGCDDHKTWYGKPMQPMPFTYSREQPQNRGDEALRWTLAHLLPLLRKS